MDVIESSKTEIAFFANSELGRELGSPVQAVQIARSFAEAESALGA